jgi:UDP-N-acetylglucosamine 3-dehydrogenase
MTYKKSFTEIRTGVIGVGSMGQNHARVYNEISNFVAVADPNEEQGRRVAERFGVTWYSDYREMLGEVDAVTIAVPTALHREVAESVAAMNVHLLVEKPLAGNMEDAQAIIAAAKASGITLAVGHVERHNAIVANAKMCIDNGEWGNILTLSAKRVSSYPSRIRDVGVLFDLTIHDVDVICYLVNSPVKKVYAAGGKLMNGQHEDHVNLVMGFEDGRMGICETNWLTPMKVREMNITTTACYINLNYLTQEIEILSSKFGEIDESNLYQPPMDISKQKISLKGEEPLKRELVDFLAAILEKRPPLVTGEEGLNVVKIVEAGLKSVKNNLVFNI